MQKVFQRRSYSYRRETCHIGTLVGTNKLIQNLIGLSHKVVAIK